MSESGSRSACDGAAPPVSNVNQLTGAGNLSSDSAAGDTHAPSASAAVRASATSRAGCGGGGGFGGADSASRCIGTATLTAAVDSMSPAADPHGAILCASGAIPVSGGAAAESVSSAVVGPPPTVGELSSAAYEGDTAAAESLIARGANVNENNGFVSS